MDTAHEKSSKAAVRWKASKTWVREKLVTMDTENEKSTKTAARWKAIKA